MTVAHRHTSFLFLAGLAFGLALVILAIMLVNPQTLGEAHSWVTATASLGLLGLLWWAGSRWLAANYPGELIWLHPPFLITAWVFISMAVPGWYSFVDQTILLETPAIIDYSFAAWGSLLVVVGCLCLWIGYALGSQFFAPSAFVKRLAQRPIHLKILLLFYGIAVVAQIVQIRVVGIAYGADQAGWGGATIIQQTVGYLQAIWPLILAILAVRVFRREWPAWPLVMVIAVQTLFGYASGFMKPVFWMSIVLLLAALANKVRLKRIVIPALGLLMIGFIIVPVAENMRSTITEYDTRDLTEVTNATGEAVQSALSSDMRANWSLVIDRFLFRQALIAHTPGIIMLRTPALYPYLGIEQFLAIPTYLIPRSLWPDKPELTKGVWFAINYLNQPSSNTSSAAITVFGEGYMLAGWVGTVLACALLGLFLAFTYQKTMQSGLLPVFLALAPTFMDIEGQFTGLVVALIQRLLIFMFIYWLMAVLSRRPDDNLLPAARDTLRYRS